MGQIRSLHGVVDIGDFDTQFDALLSLSEWAKLYEQKHNVVLNKQTLRKRRATSGLGRFYPPGVYLFSKEEFLNVLSTPLPMCRRAMIEVRR